jgi:hypothetical protein
MKTHNLLLFMGQADTFLKAHFVAVMNVLKTIKPADLQESIRAIVALDKLQEAAKLAGRPLSAQIRAIVSRSWRMAAAVVLTARGMMRLKGEEPDAALPRPPSRKDWASRLEYLVGIAQFIRQHPEIPVVDGKVREQDVDTLRHLRVAFGDSRHRQRALTDKLDQELADKVDATVAWISLYRAAARLGGLRDVLSQSPRLAEFRGKRKGRRPSMQAASNEAA